MDHVFVCPHCGKKTTDYDRAGAYCNNQSCPVKVFKKSRLQDQKIIYKTKGDVFNANWMHSDWVDWWLRNYMSDGNSLNAACGYSMVGDVRLDKSPDSTRTIDGNYKSLLEQFGENAFDYVYIDALYDDYVTGKNRNIWQLDAYKVARKCLITKRPRVNINMPSSKHYYSILEETTPALSLLRFDMKNPGVSLI